MKEQNNNYCRPSWFSRLLDYMAKRPKVELILIKTFCRVALILAVLIGVGLLLGIEKSIQPIVNQALPAKYRTANCE